MSAVSNRLLLAAAALVLVAAGDIDAKSVIADRQTTMKGFGDKVKLIKAYADGTGDQTAALDAAKAIEATAPRIPSFFPAGTGPEVPGSKTHAKPEIWTDHAHFEADAKQLGDQAHLLVAAIESGDRAGAKTQLAQTGKSGCGACHDGFRTPLE